MKKYIYKPKKLEDLSRYIKKQVVKKANPSFFEKIKKLF